MAEVYKAIAAVQGELAKHGIGKDRENKQQGYSFRGIDDIYNELAPLLSRHQLCILPEVIERIPTERASKNGGVLFHVVVRMRFTFVSAVDASSHIVTIDGEAMDSADKATNKAMSAAYKYACLQTFCIPTEGDNDADASTPSVAAKSGPDYDALLWACESLDELADVWRSMSETARKAHVLSKDNRKAELQTKEAGK